MSESVNIIKQPPLHDLQKRIKTFLDKELFDQVRELLKEMHPAEIAALMTGLGAFERNFIFDLTPTDIQHEVLTELEEGDQERVLDRLSDQRIADFLLHLESDDATDVAALLDEDTRERVLEATPQEDREEVEQLLEYDEESAGGLMAVELTTVNKNDSVADAVEIVRKSKDSGMEDIHYVYVVGDNNKLLGRISILDMMLAPRKQIVLDILDDDMVVIGEQMDQEEVAQIFQRYDLISAPVVNKDDQLVGRITVDDIVDVIHDEADEDIGYLAGTGEEEVSERNILVATKARLPWLVIAFFGELIGALVVSKFADSLSTVILIAFFIPVIIAVAGNIGIQSSTIVVRGLATGEILPQKIFVRVGREVLVSILNGLVLSVMLFAMLMIWKGSIVVALALGISLIVVVIMAALVGSLTPFILKKFNQDPALASGPFITMTNDVVGLTIYLLITSAMLA